MSTYEEGEIKQDIPNYVDSKIDWSGTFTWHIDEPFRYKLSLAKHSQAFESSKFTIGKVKWFLRLYPNGSGKNNKGFVNLFLYISSMPSKVFYLKVKYLLSCNETETNWNHIKTYSTKTMGSGWSNHRLQSDKLFKFNSFNFKVDVAIIDMYDKQKNKINNNIVPVPSSAPLLSIINNHSDYKDNDIIEIKQNIQMLSQQIQEMNIMLNNIMNKVDINYEKDKMIINNNKTNSLILGMLKDIKKDIKQLKNDVPFSSDDNDNDNTVNVDPLQTFFQNIGLTQYYQLFLNYGIDDINLVKQMQQDQVESLNYEKPEHKIKIWKAIQLLKQQ